MTIHSPQLATQYPYLIEGHETFDIEYPTFFTPVPIEFYRPTRLNRLRRLIARVLCELAARIDA